MVWWGDMIQIKILKALIDEIEQKSQVMLYLMEEVPDGWASKSKGIKGKQSGYHLEKEKMQG